VTVKTALRDLNNAMLDIQSADYDTWDQPLKRLSKALQSDDLRKFSEKLTDGLDLDSFIATSSGRGMGNAQLNWPDDTEQRLGLIILLVERGAADSEWFFKFSHSHYSASSSKIISSIRKITSSLLIPFARDFKDFVEATASVKTMAQFEPTDFNRIFIVHGHDEAPRETVARFIASVGLEPVILHEQANRGMTISEKLMANGNVGFAVVLLTPDDMGRAKTETEDKPRARQNVILELGYFVGRLGRDRVCALLKDSVEIPSDYMGVVYTQFDVGGGWRQQLAKELQAAGYDIDWNIVMRG